MDKFNTAGDHIQAKTLLRRYADDTASEMERDLFEQWYINLNRNDLVMLNEEDLEEIEKKLLISLMDKIKPTKEIRLWPRIALTAAAITAITLGVWFFYVSYISGRHPEFISGSSLANDIKPGSNKATITLANGKTIELSNTQTGIVIGNELTYNDGSTVANLSPSGRDAKGREGNNSGNPLSPQGGSLPEGERGRVQTLTASTPRGGTYQVTLPDGTHVWLNADSKISFPSQFSGKERRISLSGEAYFEVTKRLYRSGKYDHRPQRIPFIVESKGQEVEVLGTHFNINCYSDEATVKTTLLEGSVRVAFLSPSGRDGEAREGNTREGSKNNNNPLSPQGGSLPEGERSIVLKPNQQATLLSPSGRDGVAREGKITVNLANIEEAISWKEGVFRFENENIQSIMRKLARWYNIDVVYEGKFSTEGFTGKISRNNNIREVLMMLEQTKSVKFKIEGRRVTIIQ